MISLFRVLLAPILSLIFTSLGIGLFTTFVSVRLEIAGYSTTLIAAVVSSFYAGVFLGALTSPRLVKKFGYSRSLVLIYVINAIAILCHSFWVDAYYWMFLRFIVGIAIGGFFTVMDSWFLQKGGHKMRSQAMSLNLLLFYGSLSVGQLLLNVSTPRSLGTIFLAGALSILAIVPICIKPTKMPPKAEAIASKESCRFSLLGLLGGFASGMIIAMVYGLVPVYGKEIHLTFEQISIFMAIIIFGGFLMQWPMGKWADAQGKKPVLMIASFAAALLSGFIAFVNGFSFPWLLLFSWLFGGMAFTLYPLSIAYVCDDVEDEELPAAAGRFVSSYGIGAVAGPLLGSYAMLLLGNGGLFYLIALVCVLLGFIPLLRK